MPRIPILAHGTVTSNTMGNETSTQKQNLSLCRERTTQTRKHRHPPMKTVPQPSLRRENKHNVKNKQFHRTKQLHTKNEPHPPHKHEHHYTRRTDRQTDGKTDRQKNRQTDRQTDRQKNKQTEKQTDRQTDRQTTTRYSRGSQHITANRTHSPCANTSQP